MRGGRGQIPLFPNPVLQLRTATKLPKLSKLPNSLPRDLDLVKHDGRCHVADAEGVPELSCQYQLSQKAHSTKSTLAQFNHGLYEIVQL